MTKPITATKTPGPAYAAALRGLGLRRGHDFRVRTLTNYGRTMYTYVELITPAARLAVARNLDTVRTAVAERGWPVGFHCYERGDLAMGGHIGADSLYWLAEVLRINAAA
jgi:hypothetical protein